MKTNILSYWELDQSVFFITKVAQDNAAIGFLTSSPVHSAAASLKSVPNK